MPRKIAEYTLNVDQSSVVTIDMPEGAIPFAVETRVNQPVLFAMGDPEAKKTPRTFRLAENNETILNHPSTLKYVGTTFVDVSEGMGIGLPAVALHVFEVLP